jgi:hypothetical protein
MKVACLFKPQETARLGKEMRTLKSELQKALDKTKEAKKKVPTIPSEDLDEDWLHQPPEYSKPGKTDTAPLMSTVLSCRESG